MDLGDNYASLSGRSSPSSFYFPRKAVGSRISLTPLLAEDQQDTDPQPEPTSDASTAYTRIHRPLLNSHERRFSPRKQLRHLLFIGFIRFLITAALIGGIYTTIYFYKAKPVMSEQVDKIWFNFYTTGLSMLLGISIASGLKQIAIDIRWRILSRGNRPLREVDGILNANSLTKLLHLALSSVPKWHLRITATTFLWIMINIAGQASVAMLALTYSMSPVIVPSPPEVGPVTVSNLSSFAINFAQEGDATSLSFRQANQLAAHTYGEMSITYAQLTTNSTNPSINPIEPNVLHNDMYMYYWAGPDYFQYVFQQWSYDGDSPIGQFYSNRSIAASCTCAVYDVKEGANGSTNDIQYQSSTGQMMTRSFKLIQPNSTTYYTNAEAIDCGDRCANVCAFENNGEAGYYYECQVTLSNVTNVYDPSHEISDYTARTAAASIALQGYQSDAQDAQYQRYPEEFWYGSWLAGDNASMADRMSQFAIGAIVGADQNNPAISYDLTGSIPRQGVVLNIDKPQYFHAILLSIATVQLILFIGGALLANKVVVLDESYISISNLFKPLLKDLHDGSLLDGKEICDVLGKEKTVAYGSALRESEKGGVRYLKIESKGVERRFPGGWYN